jgi:hypothetical protein
MLTRSRPFLLLLPLLVAPAAAHSFCGFYVARGDAKIFNQASQVVLVRDGDRTVVTMRSDFRGAPRDFAVVIPVPTLIERGQIHVGDPAIVDHLDAYSAPRLVETFDPDPCPRAMADHMRGGRDNELRMALHGAKLMEEVSAKVRVEAAYHVDEYDILILSATESGALERWLVDHGYRIPAGAAEVLAGYLKQGMRFFVAKINLQERARLGVDKLRPIQVAFESPKFALPIRLGMVNAAGPQELFVYALTRTGRVETTNYRTVRLPSGDEIPPFVKDDFSRFYKDMFARQVEREDHRGVFLEYAWDMAWCDPCAADPLSAAELRELGVFWVDGGPEARRVAPPFPGGGAQNVFVSRLHVSYDGERFPEDLRFQETGDRANFQGRYVLRHPWTGPTRCEAGERYRAELAERQTREAATLASLTGWPLAEIRDRMKLGAEAKPAEDEPWWKRIWGG